MPPSHHRLMALPSSHSGMSFTTVNIFESVHSDYWNRDYLGKWDLGCRIKHRESTWRFSFMGRKTNMAKYMRVKAKLKEQARAKSVPLSAIPFKFRDEGME